MKTADKVNGIIDELENQEQAAPEITMDFDAQNIADSLINKYGCDKVDLDTGTLINPDDSAISKPLDAVNKKYTVGYGTRELPPSKNPLVRIKNFIRRKVRGMADLFIVGHNFETGSRTAATIELPDVINQQNEINSYLLATINAMNARRGQYESEFSRLNEEIKKREEEIYLLKSQIAVLSDRVNSKGSKS